MTHRFGYIPDRLDPRDHYFSAPPQKIPPSADLASVRPNQPILNQGDLGSCVWNATAGAVLFHQPDFMLSRLWGYYKTRVAEGTVAEDAGCEIRDAVKVITKLGAPPESDWPYNIKKYTKAPPAKATKDAKNEVVSQYRRIPNAIAARTCIATGNPYLVGFMLYESFESDEVAETGIVPMPEPGEKIIGGHCVLGFGYTPDMDTFVNSWGPDWGDKGKFHLPANYLNNPKLASDMWSITTCGQKVKKS